MNADSIKIECEEDGFHMIVTVDEIRINMNENRFDFNIHGCAEALHEQVNLRIGGWLAEGEAVKRCRWEDRDGCAVGGYAENDPKHPEFHSVHADHYDNREKV